VRLEDDDEDQDRRKFVATIFHWLMQMRAYNLFIYKLKSLTYPWF